MEKVGGYPRAGGRKIVEDFLKIDFPSPDVVFVFPLCCSYDVVRRS